MFNLFIKSAYKLIIVIACFTAMAGAINAQECRNATSPEKQVIEKMITTVKEKLVAPILQAGWKINNESSTLPNPQIAKSPGPVRPLMICMNPYTVNLAPEETSALGKKIMDSVKYYQNQNTVQATLDMARLIAAGEAEISIKENIPYLNIYVAPSAKITRLSLPAVPLAFQIPDKDDPSKIITYLHFGNWTNARLTSGNDAYASHYPFHHPLSSPFIENMVVHIKATPQLTDMILKKTDWQQVGLSLTP